MITDFFEEFILQDWISEPDPAGGFKWVNKDGVHFYAGIATDSSREARIAYQQGMKVMYTIVFQDILPLEHSDLVKRVSNGKLYRITSDPDDMKTPMVAEVQYMQVSAEVVKVAERTDRT